MRFTRKRFTPSSTRDTAGRKCAVKTLGGVSRFSQSRIGMSVRREWLMQKYQLQGSKCARCPEPLSLTDAVFLTTNFLSGVVPDVVHKSCRRKYEKEHGTDDKDDKANI